MIYEFPLPDIGEGLVEGEVVKWHVKEGDAVKENQAIVTVLTDKAEVEIPSPKTGTVLKLLAKPGEKVKVHAPLISFELAGGMPGGGASDKTIRLGPDTLSSLGLAGLGGGSSAPAASATPAASSGPAASAVPSSSPSSAAKPAGTVMALPSVRKLALDLKVEIEKVTGTGPGGRITEEDVRKAAGGIAPANATAPTTPTTPLKAVSASGTTTSLTLPPFESLLPAKPPVTPAPVSTPSTAKPAVTPFEIPAAAGEPASPEKPPLAVALGLEERVPFVGIRRRIAEKMAQSAHTVAAVTHMDECDFTALVALRAELKPEAAQKGVKLTYLPFIMKALVLSLKEFQDLNATLDEAGGAIVRKRYYHFGVATNAEQGLVVPVIKDVEKKDIWALAADITRLADKVRSNKIDVTDLQGGTFTITNIGPIGGLFATPIVNHPEVGILGVMKIQKRPIVRDNGIQIRDMANLALTFDHRVLDGAAAAGFMNTLVKHLENPRTLL